MRDILCIYSRYQLSQLRQCHLHHSTTSMLTGDQTTRLLLRVMDRMVEARWLHSHTFTDGKGHHLAWTQADTRRSMILRKISTHFRLMIDGRAPLVFDMIAHGDRLPDSVQPVELNATVTKFWCECVAQLGLRGDADGLRALVYIIAGWKPNVNTPVRIEG